MHEKKSSVISVRVPEDVRRKLAIEAEMESLTMNTLISRILAHHVEWEKFSEEIGFVSVTRPFLRVVLEELPDDALKHIAATTCRSAFKDAVIYTQGGMTVENILKTLELWLGSSHVPFRHIKKESGDKFIIQHELGEKWSIYFITLISTLLNEVGYKPINEVKTQQTVSFEIAKI